jgi:hypothetical protein
VLSYCSRRGESGIYVGGLEGSLEDCDCVILGCDIAEVLGTTMDLLVLFPTCSGDMIEPYYFSTHG